MTRIVVLFCSMLLNAAGSFAQIEGGIDDRTGKAVPNTTLTAVDPAGKVVATVRSDDRGYYGFRGLKPGKYMIETRADGFRPAIYKNIIVKDGDTGAIPGEEDLYKGVRLDIVLSTDTVHYQIEGQVIDQREKGLANISVIAIDSTGKMVGTAKSDNMGFYGLKDLLPGKYKIEAKAVGFHSVVYNSVSVPVPESGEGDISQSIWLYIVLASVKKPE